MSNNQNGFGALDAISLISFFAQMNNMEGDKKYKDFVQAFSSMIKTEIDKLHDENEIIMQKLNAIQTELKKMEYK